MLDALAVFTAAEMGVLPQTLRRVPAQFDALPTTC